MKLMQMKNPYANKVYDCLLKFSKGSKQNTISGISFLKGSKSKTLNHTS